jgi:hypothetical protein
MVASEQPSSFVGGDTINAVIHYPIVFEQSRIALIILNIFFTFLFIHLIIDFLWY